MAMPASQLAAASQPSSQRARAAQPRNGAAKLTSPMAVACFHCRRNTTGIELSTGEEGEQDRARPGQELDPGGVAGQQRAAQRRADDQLGDGADHDLGQRGGDAQPDGQQRGEQRESEPKRGLGPDLGHGWPPSVKPKSTGTRR